MGGARILFSAARETAASVEEAVARRRLLRVGGSPVPSSAARETAASVEEAVARRRL